MRSIPNKITKSPTCGQPLICNRKVGSKVSHEDIHHQSNTGDENQVKRRKREIKT